MKNHKRNFLNRVQVFTLNTAMSFLLLTMLLTLLNSTAHAKFVTALNFEPYAFYSTGNYKFSGSSEKGSLQNMGAGLRAGLAFQYFSLSADYRTGASSNKPQQSTMNDTFNNPSKTQSMTEYGATAAIELGFFQLYYSYFLNSELKSKGFTGSMVPFDYSYHGTAQEYGVKLILYRGFSIAVGQHIANYKKYSRSSYNESGSGEIPAVKNQTRSALETQQWTGSLSYQFLF